MATEAVSSIGTGNSVKDARYVNNIPFYAGSLMTAIDEARGLVFRNNSNEITKYSFLGGTFIEKGLDRFAPSIGAAVKTLDHSLIDSKFVQKTVENVFDCDIKKMGKTGRLVLTSAEETLKTKAARLTADTLGTTTRFGLVTSALAEAPALYHSYQNGDFGKQTVRSTANIATGAAAFGIVSHLAKELAPAKYKTLFTVAGAVLGSIGATKATNAILDKVMGESIQSQNEKARDKIAQMRNNRATSAV